MRFTTEDLAVVAVDHYGSEKDEPLRRKDGSLVYFVDVQPIGGISSEPLRLTVEAGVNVPEVGAVIRVHGSALVSVDAKIGASGRAYIARTTKLRFSGYEVAA